MPSPIAHATAGYAVYRLLAGRKLWANSRHIGPLPVMLVTAIVLSFLPDFDFVPGFIVGDIDVFHNSYSNSVIVGSLLALMVGLLGGVTKRGYFALWFLIVLLAYNLHVLMDYFGSERGTMLFWPIVDERYTTPIKLFYGLHRSDGLWSIRHVWTVISELIFAIIIIVTVNVIGRRKGWSTGMGAYKVSVPVDEEVARIS